MQSVDLGRDGSAMNCTIRLASESDADQIRAIYAPFVTETAISFELETPTVQEFERRILQGLERMPWLVCEMEGEVVGYAYATNHRHRVAYQWSAESSVYVSPRRRRCGVGRGLYASLPSILALQGYRSAYGGITLPNPASVGLHEACGFKKIGVYKEVGYKLGVWHDVGWWGLSLRDEPADPAPPTPLPEIRAHPEYTAALAGGLRFIRSS